MRTSVRVDVGVDVGVDDGPFSAPSFRGVLAGLSLALLEFFPLNQPARNWSPSPAHRNLMGHSEI